MDWLERVAHLMIEAVLVYIVIEQLRGRERVVAVAPQTLEATASEVRVRGGLPIAW